MAKQVTLTRCKATRALVAMVAALALAATIAITGCSGQQAPTSDQGQQDAQRSTLSVSDLSESGKSDIGQAVILAPEKLRTTGFVIEPKVKVALGGKTLSRGVDYEVSYENNKKPGMASIIVKGIGDYEGSAVKHFLISGRYNPRILVLDKSPSSASGMISYLTRNGCRAVFTVKTDIDINKFDGLAIPGGNDVDPSFYGEENVRSHKVFPILDEAQIKMVRKFAEAGKPVFGICRGSQIINVAFGGSLYQNIEGGHDGTYYAAVKKGSWLYGLFGDKFLTAHGHHQAMHELGEGLVPTQWCHKDELRIVEMIEHSTYPVWGVQYHPECMGKPGDAIARKFRAEVMKLI